MELERVLREIQATGSYWRGDSTINWDGHLATLSFALKDSSIVSKLLPNLPEDIKNRIKYPKNWEALHLTNLPAWATLNRITASNPGADAKEAIAPLVEYANSIVYPDVHITRRAGAYILVLDGKAVYATESVIDYCPLAKMLFTRHSYGKDMPFKEKLIKEMNEQAIGEFKMFSGQRSLRECEAKVPFGSSEISMDAMRKGLYEALVQVCDGVGTVITFDPEHSQGVGAVMTGTFYTTPIDELVKKCHQENVFPVFPETGEIDQLTGVKAAIRLGKKNIAVSTAVGFNRNLGDIAALETDDIKIYRFALCSTGIDEETAQAMAKYADIAWSCASKPAREIIAPKALIQIGLKIPVYVMTERGWDITKNRLETIDPELASQDIPLGKGYIIAHDGKQKLRLIHSSQVREGLVDSPRPLV